MQDMRNMKLVFVMVLCMFSLTLFGQSDKGSLDNWGWLLGEWVGEGQGIPGKGVGKFSFKLELGESIVERKAIATYPAANGRPAIVHEDLMIIYRDAAGVPYKAIYFDNEKHLINYTVLLSEGSIVFLSDKAISLPVFRLTYTFIESGKISVRFEMAGDGVNFKTYVEGVSTRLNRQVGE